MQSLSNITAGIRTQTRNQFLFRLRTACTSTALSYFLRRLWIFTPVLISHQVVVLCRDDLVNTSNKLQHVTQNRMCSSCVTSLVWFRGLCRLTRFPTIHTFPHSSIVPAVARQISEGGGPDTFGKSSFVYEAGKIIAVCWIKARLQPTIHIFFVPAIYSEADSTCNACI